MKPIGERLILKVDKLFKKGSEKDPEVIGFSQEAKVMESNCPEIKKGSVVYYNPRGAISVQSLETKKQIVLIVDLDDVYALVTK